MNVFAIAALAAIGSVGALKTVHGVKTLSHTIAAAVSKLFHHKPKPVAT